VPLSYLKLNTSKFKNKIIKKLYNILLSFIINKYSLLIEDLSKDNNSINRDYIIEDELVKNNINI
jgi:hypothetical protein